MAQTRFTCILARADEPACTSYARVTITDAEGATARDCLRHAAAALDSITGARVDWAHSWVSTSGSAWPWSCSQLAAGGR